MNAAVESPSKTEPLSPPLLDMARLDDAHCEVHHQPFQFLIARGQLPPEAKPELARDFPHYAGAGFFPYDPADCGPSINRLIETLLAPTFANAIGQRLGVPRLAGYPTLITLCRSLNRRHGTVHTDSQSKIVTALLYLNEHWDAGSAGTLRFLANQDDLDAQVAPELPPLYGNLAAFRRSDNSWHGHVPYEGERRVIQVAWLTSEAEKQRKTRRGRLSRFVKWLTGGLDRRFKART
jgi:hypothetical protein